jgi:hypothetical protein
MAYLEYFEQVVEHILRLGVKANFKRGKPVRAIADKRAQEKALIPIPHSLAEFYLEIGDGMELWWNGKGDDAPFANLEVATLKSKTLTSWERVKWRTEWDDSYDFSGTDDPQLAKRTAMRMR